MIVNEETEEVRRILEYARVANRRMVVRNGRKEVIAPFLHLMETDDGVGVRDLLKFLRLFLDFRDEKNPAKEVTLSTLETVVYTIRKELEEE